MHTLTKTNRAAVTVRIRKITVSPAVHFWTEMENSRFALIPMILVIIGCMGGLAAGFGTGNSTFELAVVIIATVIPLALLLSVSPMKPVLCLGMAALLLDVLVLIF